MGDSAMHLALEQPRIDNDAGVGDGSQPVDSRRAGLRVDFNLTDHDAGGVGFDLVSKYGVSGERREGSELEQGYAAVGADDFELAVAKGDVRWRCLESFGG